LTSPPVGRRPRLPEPSEDGAGVDRRGLPHAVRRDALLDAAAELLSTGDVESVSMEAVAERAGVSRPLVYKHFPNRSELLAALYTRESGALHRELASVVEAAPTLEEMFRALIKGLLRAQASRGATTAALRSAGVRNDAHRQRQARRNQNTVSYFTDQAVAEFGLPRRQCRAAVAVALGATEAVMNQWRLRPTSDYALVLQEAYVALAMGGLERLARG